MCFGGENYVDGAIHMRHVQLIIKDETYPVATTEVVPNTQKLVT